MRERKSHLDRLLDLFVYAPAGLLFESRELLPKLAAKGREELGTQVQTARLIGQFGVRKGQQEATKVVSKLREPAGASATSGSAAASTPASSPFVDPDIAEEIPVRIEDDPVTVESVGADELAIPSYDSLAASQVVQRLDGLTEAELDAVRRYELAHRGRKTVLGKVAELQGL